MNWIGIAGGAIGGVVAVLISSLVMRMLGRKNQTVHYVVFAVVMALTMAISRDYVQPAVAASQTEGVLLKLPVYQALQEHEPEVYARIVQVVKDGVARGAAKEYMWAQTRPMISGVIERRSKSASDDALLLLASVVVEEVRALHAVGDTSCHAMLLPTPGGPQIDLLKVVGKDVAERELAAQTAIIRSSASSPKPVPAAADVAQLLERVGAVLGKSYSEAELASLQSPGAPGVDKRKICEMTLTIYTELLTWPPAEGGKLMRFMMNS
jgi:hypothetical protein